ncbi:peptidoglycan editing factor PgeF [Marinobacterium rhizophilum]|uniref:Purine nucleoside phosphorylase n=1 Tax=Marinobacterium rhizophilum TaxID=420402 RepID=A0ABY5HIN3_9GAMM|nr:peptidoglycan editing factor PgeF [Marinobacterium rhizophilum]UTW11120.1 peptidoglycan editing factor PgeF [Marinobacterium rhizophilum]
MKLLRPQWPVSGRVQACVSTRQGGASRGAFQGLNLGDHVGDDPQSVAQNRQNLAAQLGLERPAQWLQQVHGVDVVQAVADGQVRQADACWSDQPGLACVVMTADCLPVFFSDGCKVAVAHAGWRGLVAGILENTLAVFERPEQVHCWLGPAIGPEAFEVGAEVQEAFCVAHPAAAEAFVARVGVPGKYFADIYALARLRLEAIGVASVSGGDFCTLNDAQNFYSYRRDGETGRMASLIWLA